MRLLTVLRNNYKKVSVHCLVLPRYINLNYNSYKNKCETINKGNMCGIHEKYKLRKIHLNSYNHFFHSALTECAILLWLTST